MATDKYQKKLAETAKKETKGDEGNLFRAAYTTDVTSDIPETVVATSPIAGIAGNYGLNVTADGLTQVDPNVALSEGEQFIQNFNAVQAANNAAVGDVTHRQGMDIPAQTGGLHGTDYWTNLYQNKQVDAQIAGLRSAMQLQALTNTMQNVQDAEAEKLNQLNRQYNNLRAKYIPKFYDYSINPNQGLYDPDAAKKQLAAQRAAAAQSAAAAQAQYQSGQGNSGTGVKGGQSAGTVRSSAPGTTTVLNTATGYFDVYQNDKNGNPTSTRLYSYDKTGQRVDGSKPSSGKVVKEYSAPGEDIGGIAGKVGSAIVGVTTTIANPIQGASYLGGKLLRKIFGK